MPVSAKFINAQRDLENATHRLSRLQQIAKLINGADDSDELQGALAKSLIASRKEVAAAREALQNTER